MSEIGFGHALYYPYIHLQDETWLKTAALYYDRLSRIVPDDFLTNDSEIVKQLDDEVGLISNLSPRHEALEIAHDFLKFAKEELSSKAKRKRILAKIGNKLPAKSNFSIHMDKMAMLLREELPKLGLAKKSIFKRSSASEWFEFEPVTGALYMTHLANRMAERRGFTIVTDDADYQPLIRGIQSDRSSDTSDIGHALASLVIETAVPEKIENISIKKVVEFRKKHDDERQQFFEGIRSIAKDIPVIEDTESLEECLNHHKKSIEIAVKNLKFSFKSIGISSTTGLLGISVPSWATKIAKIQSAIGVQVVSGGLICMAMGVFLKEGINYYKSRKESPWSYVLSLEKIGKDRFIEGLIHGTVLI
jgi:hypothetical protein